MAGGRIDIEVGLDMKNLPAQLQAGAQPALGMAKKMAGAIGLSLGAAAAVGTVKQIVAIGNAYTTSLNTSQAVSKATDAQMAAVSERSKQLGNDIELPGTSAVDAAAAMTELAKGGFTVEQSMSAAKGTLQLAAAAQIDATTAATIQSQALQAFGKDATFAATAADILANTANASSAEITDVAAGLQQSGSVANQFGLTMEDTAATLGVLSNAGITGSDAGTLLKSTLLALTDQGKPAQAAIEELGLTVYDAGGKFVGMQELFRQLEVASKSMTEEQYQAAAATLFGSDAMRLAGVAAEQGVAGYDSMREAVGQQGAAAEVAAAKTQGLPGAMGSVQNSVETLALELYDLVDGPMESFARGAADKIGSATPVIVDALGTAGKAVGEVGSAFMELPGAVQVAAGAFAGIKAFGLDDTAGAWVDGLKEKFAGFRDEMELQKSLGSEAASESADGYDELGNALEENSEQISDVVAGFATLEARVPAVRAMGDAYRGVTTRTQNFADRQRALGTVTGGVSGQMRMAAASCAQFAGVAGGVAAAGARGLSSAVKGIVSVMGGLPMVGIMAATYLVGTIASATRKVQTANDTYAESARNVADAQRDMALAFIESEGAINDTVLATVQAQADSILSTANTIKASKPGVGDQIGGVLSDFMHGRVNQDLSTDPDSTTKALGNLADDAASAEAYTSALEKMNMTSSDLARILAGSEEGWQSFSGALRDNGGLLTEEYMSLMGVRQEISRLQQVAQEVGPEYYALSDGIAMIAESAGDSEKKVAGLKKVLDILAGGDVSFTESLDKYNESIRNVADAAIKAADPAKGFGDALIDADGRLKTGTENGKELSDQLRELGQSSVEYAEKVYKQAQLEGATVPEAQAKAREALGQTETSLQQLADKYDLPIAKVKEFAESRGYLPDELIMHLALEVADDATQQLAAIRDDLKIDLDKTIKVDVLDKGVRNVLEDIGVQVKDMPNGTVEITANGDIAKTVLDEVIQKTLETGGTLADVQIDADTTGFKIGVAEAQTLIGQLDASKAEPAVGLILDKLKEGKTITLNDLIELDRSSASPEVKALVAQALTDLQTVKDGVNGLPPNKTVDITVRFNEIRSVAQQYGAWSEEAIKAAWPEYQGTPGREHGGRLPAFAGGGRMPGSGPGTETVDGIYAVTPSGVGIAMVNGKEWVVNAQSSEKYDRELAMINAGTFPKLPGFAAGGRLPQDRIEDLGRQMDGVPYVLGGASLAGADCSGFVAMHQRAAMGEDPPVGRLGTTYTLLDGSWPHLVPGIQGPFVVGVNEEHMALTAYGTNYESGGAYGTAKMGGSVGAFDPQFHSHYYLPWDKFSPPVESASQTASDYTAQAQSSKKATWTEKDQLNLDSAIIAVTQAKEAEARIRATAGKTDADRAQAAKKVEKAEERVRSYEAKRDAAKAGKDAPPAPEAPDLETALTDDQISLRQAQRAVEKARLDRNEVYADAESTQQERDEADDALQSARNALAQKQKGTSDSSLPSTWSELLGTVAKDFVTENAADILGYYGVDSTGPLVQAGMAIAKASENGFKEQAPLPNEPITPAEAQTQLPVTPGTPDWMANMLKSIKVFDRGGKLGPGELGLNLSGADEFILNPRETADMELTKKMFQGLRATGTQTAQPETARPRHDAFASQRPIDVHVNGYDRHEIDAGLRMARTREDYETAHIRI